MVQQPGWRGAIQGVAIPAGRPRQRLLSRALVFCVRCWLTTPALSALSLLHRHPRAHHMLLCLRRVLLGALHLPALPLHLLYLPVQRLQATDGSCCSCCRWTIACCC